MEKDIWRTSAFFFFAAKLYPTSYLLFYRHKGQKGAEK